MKKDKKEFPYGFFLFGATTYTMTISSYSKPVLDTSSKCYLHVNAFIILFYFSLVWFVCFGLFIFFYCGLFACKFEVIVHNDFKKCLTNNPNLFLMPMRPKL